MSNDAILSVRPEVRARVRRFTAALQASDQAGHVLAVVVAGSASRGEDIWNAGRLVSDIDLMLVTHRTSPHRTRSLTAIMNRFREEGIDGGPTPLPSLRRFRTFAFYEARTTGFVVWGNHDLRSLLPPMSAADLPHWEAIRVLANRMFEHLKVAAGQSTPARASAKTYEALSEAALALEGRYRPSYRDRLAELTRHPPVLLSPPACGTAAAVLRARLAQQPWPAVLAGAARRDLLTGLGSALRRYLCADGTVTELLGLLGEKEKHWRHRAYWASGHLEYARSTRLKTDPVIRLWQQAAAALLGQPTSGTAEGLIEAWKACPQILRHHDAAYADGSLSATLGGPGIPR